MFESVIRTNVDIDRAHQKRKTIFELDKKKPGAQDYLAFSREIIRMCDAVKKKPKELDNPFENMVPPQDYDFMANVDKDEFART